ncbi:MAG: HAMP domain-containing protein [Nitrosomonadales bacterium]|nr:HAMP domain-containing protein [Nitrosomonadales bacterium]
MLIKTQLRLVALLPAVFVLLIGSVLWGSRIKIDQARTDAEVAEKVLLSNFELNVLTQEYLLYGGKRVESQLRIRHQSMGELLAQLKYDDIKEQELIDALRHGHQELGSLYTLLLEGKIQAREQLAGVLLVRAQAIRAKTRQFADIQYQQVLEFQRLADKSIMVALVLLAACSVALLTLMTRRLMQGINELGAGMRRVEAGNLQYSIPISSADEMGALAQVFNGMTRKLESVADDLQQRSTVLSRRTVELETANADLENFSYSVSHDLRAPLRAIDGFASILREDYAPKLDEEGRRLFQVVSDNTRKMAQLINDILAFSRAGRSELRLTTLDMNALVQQVWQELEPRRAGRVIELKLADLPAVRGGLGAIHQVLQNLLDNAVKFTRRREAAVIEVAGHREGDENIYSIRDNGAGFDMAYVGKLFGLFQRLHSMEEFEGTGVGLSIVKRFITKHGGRVWAEGKTGEGATFWFALPAETIAE